MKWITSIFVVAFLIFGLVGVAAAKRMTGEVVDIDRAKEVLTIEKGKKKIDFECELSKLKGIKIGDRVSVYYYEEKSGKTVYKVKKKRKKAAIGC